MGGALATAVAKAVGGENLLLCDASAEKAETQGPSDLPPKKYASAFLFDLLAK